MTGRPDLILVGGGQADAVKRRHLFEKAHPDVTIVPPATTSDRWRAIVPWAASPASQIRPPSGPTGSRALWTSSLGAVASAPAGWYGPRRIAPGVPDARAARYNLAWRAHPRHDPRDSAG